MKEIKPRHEIKHFINLCDYYEIKNRLKHIAKLDVNAGIDGTYKIRSLYFDNFNNKALMEKINGVNNREKFRIRFYNDVPSVIKLEKKSKINGLCLKDSAMLTKDQCDLLLENHTSWLLKSNSNLLKELYAKMKYQFLRPKTIVDYTREAYIYEPGNVRITIDSNLRTGLFTKNLFNSNLPTLGMPVDTTMILEVKYDEFLPEIIRDIIQTKERQSTSVSKYAACRIYG